MKTLQESKKVLICTTDKPKLDHFAAMQVIATALRDDAKKEVSIGMAGKFSEKMLSALPLRDIKILNKLPPKKFVLEFKNQKNKVKTIQWNQEAETVNFYVSMENGDFANATPTFKTMGADFESVIFVGVNSVAELGTLYTENKEAFQNVNIISVGGKIQGDGMKISTEADEKSSSVSEDAYNFMQKNGLKQDKPRASALIAGIFQSTDNFKKNLKDPKTLIVCADLLKSGGSNEEAQRLIETTKDEKPKEGGDGAKKEGGAPNTSGTQSSQQSGQPKQNEAQQANKVQ